MKHQALFSSKDKSTKIKVLFAAILFGAIRVKFPCQQHFIYYIASKFVGLPWPPNPRNHISATSWSV